MKRVIVFYLLIAFTIHVSGQGKLKSDSLKIKLESEKTDTGRIILYYNIAYELQFRDIDESLQYARKALGESEKINFKKGKANALVQLANIKQLKGNYSGSDSLNRRALEIFTKTGDLKGTAICNNNLGILAHNVNDFSKALYYYRKSYQINSSINRRSGMATSLLGIGTVYENQVKYDSALINYLNAQEISESVHDLKLMAISKTSIANIYFAMGNYSKSLEYNEEALSLFSKTGNKLGMLKIYYSLGLASSLADSTGKAVWFYRQALSISRKIQSTNDIGNSLFYLARLYEDSNRNDSAMANYKQAYAQYSETDNYQNMSLTLTSMARIQNNNKNYKEARKLLGEALKIVMETESIGALSEVYYELAYTCSYLNDFSNAFSYLNKYSSIKDSLMTVEKQKQILELQTQYETEKKEKENAILRKDQQILQTTRNSLIIGALLLMTIVVVIFRSLNIKKRDNRLLQQQKEEIERQKDIVEYQKTSITDSIHYARRIQSAMLPPGDLVTNTLPDSFILYLPRDIVSGDFYWLKKIERNKILICAADCTGHGVPGAFMSMLGISLLSDIITRNQEPILQGSFTPSDILNNLRSRIKVSLHQTGKEGESRDGMDMSLCILDTDTGKLKYSGANNPVYFVSNGILTELKATRNPIGIYLNEMSFADCDVMVPKGSVLYMFSDGYSDQIGSNGSKFLSKNFKKLLSEISDLPLNKIKEKIHTTHIEWRNDEEQVDDILVIGVRV